MSFAAAKRLTNAGAKKMMDFARVKYQKIRENSRGHRLMMQTIDRFRSC